MRKILITATSIAIVLCSTGAHAANECRIKYQYNDGKGKRTTAYLSIDVGETKAVNRSRMDFVRNMKAAKVRLYNRNMPANKAYSLELRKDVQDPVIGFHVMNVRLERVKCLGTAANTPAAAVAQMEAAGSSAAQIFRHLSNVFNLSLNQIASLMKNASFTTSDFIGAAKSIGATASNAIGAAKTVRNFTSAEITSIAKAVGYSARDMARAFKTALNTPATQAIPLIVTTYVSSAVTVANAFKLAGYRSVNIVKGLIAANVNPAEIGQAIKIALRLSDEAAAITLKQAGYGATQSWQALKDGMQLSRNRIRALLQRAGYSAAQIASAERTISRN